MTFYFSNSGKSIYSTFRIESLVFIAPALFLCALLAATASAQQVTHHLFSGQQVDYAKQADYYKISLVLEGDSMLSEKAFYNDAAPYYEQMRRNKPYAVLEGERTVWYPNGQIKLQGQYKNGLLHGRLLAYWSNGQRKREEHYSYGVVVSAHAWNSRGHEVRMDPFLVLPVWRDGNAQLQKLFQYRLWDKVKSGKLEPLQGVTIWLRVFPTGWAELIEVESNLQAPDAQKELRAKVEHITDYLLGWQPGREEDEAKPMEVSVRLNFSHTDTTPGF